MIKTADTKNGTMVKKFDSVSDIVQEAMREGSKDSGCNQRLGNGKWTGRSFSNWQHLVSCVDKPTSTEVKTLDGFMQEFSKFDLPEPRVVRRRLRYNEDAEGEIDTDRVMAGEPSFWREAKRTPLMSPKTIVLLCDVSTSSSVDHTNMFWRGASAVAVADRLEASGYAVEIWGWTHVTDCFRHSLSDYLGMFRIKEAGQEFVPISCASALCPWFYRNVVLASYHGHAEVTGSYGYIKRDWNKWSHYFDFDSTTKVIQFPAVESKDGAMRAGREILNEVMGID